MSANNNNKYADGLFKQADGLLDFKASTPLNAWREVTVNPIGSAIALSALTAVPSYFAAPWLGRKFIRYLVPEQYREQVLEEFEEPERLNKFKRRAAGVVAALTGLAHLGLSYAPGAGWKSFTSWGPFDKESSLSKEALQYYMNAPAFPNYSTGSSVGVPPSAQNPPIPFNVNTAPLFGVGSPAIGGNVDALIETPIVPLRHANELIENDGYLNNRQKGVILNIFDKTDSGGKSGLVSVMDLASAATRAGLGYAGGALAGLVLGSIFSLPAKTTQQLSRTGGIANAIINTGIVGI